MNVLGSLVRNSTLLLVGTACAKALVLVSTLILGRRLGPEGFGLYSLIFAYLAFFELFADAGLDSLVVRDLSRPGKDAPRRLGDALVLRTLLILLVVPAAALLFPRLMHRPGALLVALGGAALISSVRRPSLRSLAEAPYRVRLDMGVPTVLGILAEALHLGVLVTLITYAGVAGGVSAQVISSLPFFVLLAVLSARRLRPRLQPSPVRLAQLLWATAPLLGGLVVNVVLARADAIMLQALRGTRDVGLYTAPVRIVEIANLLPILLMTSVFPLFAASQGDPTRVDRLFRGSLRTLVTVLVPFVGAQFVFAVPLVERLFGMPYREAVPVLPPLAVSEIFVFCDIVLTARLVATGMERRNFMLLGIAATANVGANFWLIPHWGPRGAAVANVVAYAVRLLAGFLFPDTRATTRLAVFAIFPALAAGVIVFAPSIFLVHHRIIAFALGVAVYPVALYLLGGLTLQDVVNLRTALRAANTRDGGGREA